MKTMTRPAVGADVPAADYEALPLIGRRRASHRAGWSSQELLTREAAMAAVWALFPAVLGVAVESLAAGRPCFAVLAVIMHQFLALFLSRRTDGRPTAWGQTEWAIVVVGAIVLLGGYVYVQAGGRLWPWHSQPASNEEQPPIMSSSKLGVLRLPPGSLPAEGSQESAVTPPSEATAEATTDPPSRAVIMAGSKSAAIFVPDTAPPQQQAATAQQTLPRDPALQPSPQQP